jgi:hypothetical protein
MSAIHRLLLLGLAIVPLGSAGCAGTKPAAFDPKLAIQSAPVCVSYSVGREWLGTALCGQTDVWQDRGMLGYTSKGYFAGQEERWVKTVANDDIRELGVLLLDAGLWDWKPEYEASADDTGPVICVNLQIGPERRAIRAQFAGDEAKSLEIGRLVSRWVDRQRPATQPRPTTR